MAFSFFLALVMSVHGVVAFGHDHGDINIDLASAAQIAGLEDKTNQPGAPIPNVECPLCYSSSDNKFALAPHALDNLEPALSSQAVIRLSLHQYESGLARAALRVRGPPHLL